MADMRGPASDNKKDEPDYYGVTRYSLACNYLALPCLQGLQGFSTPKMKPVFLFSDQSAGRDMPFVSRDIIQAII